MVVVAVAGLLVVVLALEVLWRWMTAGLPVERTLLLTAAGFTGGVGVALYLGWRRLSPAAGRAPGHVTRRLARAIECLGSARAETRLEAIEALAAVARDCRPYARPVADILATYVRDRSPWLPAELPLVLKRPAEIQACLGALGSLERRSPGREPRLDLARADLRELKLSGLNLAGADLTQANLERADLAGTCLDDAQLGRARLGGARLHGASLRRADLSGAELRGADLAGADLRDARGRPLPVDSLLQAPA